MTHCTSFQFEFAACRKRRVEADFPGGEITSNGGVLLLRQADRALGLIGSVARRLVDERQRGKVDHRFIDMLRYAMMWRCRQRRNAILYWPVHLH